MQHDQESRTVSLSFYDPDLLSSSDVPTFFIKLSLPRVRDSQAAKLECREIYARIWVFLEMFLIVNMLDEILKKLCNYSRNMATSLAILRKERIENSGSEEQLQSILSPCFSERARRKRLDDKWVLCLWLIMPWVLGLVLKAWQVRVISPRRCICKNSLTKRNFKAGSWISKQEFAQKRRISRSYCSGSGDRSNQLAEGTHQSGINHVKKIFLIMKNWIWWWRQNWNGAAILHIWSKKLPSVEPWQDKKAKKSYTERKTE